mmetsp:Transcript_172/g.181  ORF Transcript_172/g.181 Transcript_172/m.181 type:complete len:85 (+) Transcript_172:249-503(+)
MVHVLTQKVTQDDIEKLRIKFYFRAITNISKFKQHSFHEAQLMSLDQVKNMCARRNDGDDDSMSISDSASNSSEYSSDDDAVMG